MDPSKRTNGHGDVNSVFQTERFGNALLVTPRGDLAGFGQREVILERRAVVAELNDPPPEVIIFDLSRDRYFGSSFIAFLVHVAKDVQRRGGKVGLCGASSDMQQVFAVMNLDGFWTHYPTRADAVKKLARVRARDRLRRAAPKIALLVFALLVAAGSYLYLEWRSSAREREYYATFLGIWDRLEDYRLMAPSDPRLRVFLKDSREKVDAIVEDLRTAYGVRRPVRRHLYFAAHDFLQPILKDPHAVDPELDNGFLEEMEAARQCLLKDRFPDHADAVESE